jgi:DNA-directed RNA polymerase subunit delta
MKLSNLTQDELELMSYADLTYMLIKEKKKSMNTPTMFKKICKLLDYSDSEYENKIGDYYTSLTIDKRFVLLPNNEWDIRDNHSIEIVIDEDDEIDEEETELEEEETFEEQKEDDSDTIYDDENDLDDVDIDDDIDDLQIIEEEEELDVE